MVTTQRSNKIGKSRKSRTVSFLTPLNVKSQSGKESSDLQLQPAIMELNLQPAITELNLAEWVVWDPFF